MRKESTSSQNSPTFNCLICKEDRRYVSIGICNHRRICLYCIMRARLFYNEKKCSMCNTNLEEVFIVDFSNKITYDELIKGKSYYYEDDEFDKCQIYYTEMEAKEEALKLRGFNCPIKNCKSETFENLENLIEHLNKVHRRFYCIVCLNENKKFLSEMEIYNEQNLNEHIEYGEYKNDILISPPHPSCPFEKNMKFYNDEQLFKHMNDNHFICQYCKNEKNIIFYSLLENLLLHYQKNHYCCPYAECIQDVYVVFGKEEELITHLITKHHVKDASNRLQEIIFENKRNFKTFTPITGNDEFNFTEFVQELKRKSEQYKRDVVNNRSRYVTMNQPFYNNEGIEVVYEYNNDNRRGRGGKKGRKRKDYYNKYNQDNDYYNKYNQDNNSYSYNNNYYHKNNFNDNQRNNNYNNYYQKGYYNNNNYYNKGNNYENNKYHKGNYSNNNYDNKGNNNSNKYIEKENEGNEIINQVKNKSNKEQLNYSEILSFYLNSVKNYIKIKIINEKIPEEDVYLPKETIFQLIIIIDKITSPQKLIELTSLHNFGIDLGINKQLKELISSGKKDEKKFYSILNKLETLKKILLIYKYLLISSKKTDELFYKLDLDQIDSDLYEEFLDKPKKKDEKISKVEKDKREKQRKLKEEINFQNNFTNKTNNQNIKKEQEKIEFKPNQNKPKTKLAMLLDGDINEEKKENKETNKKNTEGFNLSNFNLDKDFPELK